MAVSQVGDGMSTAIVIPFRDRGIDPLRKANLEYVFGYWEAFDDGVEVHVVDDGRVGSDHFNRSAAYNRGSRVTTADILVYVESDTLVPYQQVREAITMAQTRPGLVIPFMLQRKLTEYDSELVRCGSKEPKDCEPETIYSGNNGCANVVSRDTLNVIGQWDEQFEGHGYDDIAMFLAFEAAIGTTRWVDGVAYHMYHINVNPCAPMAPTTDEDMEAHLRNLTRMQLYREAQTAEEIRRLTGIS